MTVYRLEKGTKGWRRVGPTADARIGPAGLAWGDGVVDLSTVVSAASPHPPKVEGDNRAPVGVFTLGPVFAYHASWGTATAMPFVRVGPKDLFVEDPESPLYNTHVRLDHLPSSEWEKREQMKQGDPAHRLQVFVGHNADPPVAGKGSGIFLHVWRGGGVRPTAGCTAMDYAALSSIVKWLKPQRRPLYLLVPRTVYSDLRDHWKLPEL